MESQGVAVEDYASAAEFVRDYRPGERQCLILDQHLPQTSGLDFLGSSRGATLRLPVILLTGRGDRVIRDRAYELGVGAYLEKPVNDDTLIGTIAKLVAAQPSA